MGAEESKSSNKPRTNPSTTQQRNEARMTQSEVDRLLQRQREIYAQREEALKEAERIKREKLEQEIKKQQEINNAQKTTAPQTSSLQQLPSLPTTNRTGPSNAQPLNPPVQPTTSAESMIQAKSAVYPDISRLQIDNGNSKATLRPTDVPANGPTSSNNNKPANNTTHFVLGEKLEPFVFIQHPQSNRGRPRPSTGPPRKAYSGVRARSIPRDRFKVNDGDDISCPTCNGRFTVTIYQCNAGHSSCSDCKVRSKHCGARNSEGPGLCRLPITDRRNPTLEAFISERKIHCPYFDEGCKQMIKQGDIDSHFNECKFREMICPMYNIFGRCIWRGKLAQMVEHFTNAHQMHCHGGDNTEMTLLNLTHDNRIVHFVALGSYNFLFQAMISEKDRKLYMVVQFMGSDSTDSGIDPWIYEIHIYNKSQPRRKYFYEDVCKTINVPFETIIEDANCAALPLEYAKSFTKDNALNYKFRIMKKILAQEDNYFDDLQDRHLAQHRARRRRNNNNVHNGVFVTYNSAYNGRQ